MITAKEKDLFIRGVNLILAIPAIHNQGQWMQVDARTTELDEIEVVTERTKWGDDLDPTPHTERVRVAVVEPNPQPEWDCGTKGCLAGWFVSLNKDKIVVQREQHFETDEEDEIGFDLLWAVDPTNNELITISDRAKELVGLTDHQGSMLFDASNSRGMIRRMALDFLNHGIILSPEGPDFENPYEPNDPYEDDNTDYQPITFDTKAGEYK